MRTVRAIDWKAVHALVEHKLYCQGMSFRELARKLGMGSGSAFTRMKAGKSIDADKFVLILDWLHVSYKGFLR